MKTFMLFSLYILIKVYNSKPIAKVCLNNQTTK